MGQPSKKGGGEDRADETGRRQKPLQGADRSGRPREDTQAPPGHARCARADAGGCPTAKRLARRTAGRDPAARPGEDHSRDGPRGVPSGDGAGPCEDRSKAAAREGRATAALGGGAGGARAPPRRAGGTPRGPQRVGTREDRSGAPFNQKKKRRKNSPQGKSKSKTEQSGP